MLLEYLFSIVLHALHYIFSTHEKRIDILETIKLCLVNLSNDAGVVWSQVDWLVCELRREVSQISLTLKPRSVRRRNLLLLQQSPVNGLEEGMCHDLHKA